jgi:putative transposase
MLRVVTDESTGGEPAWALDEICREGARRMLAAALEAEADAYIAELVSERDERGHRLVTRNGHAQARTITTGSGPIHIEAPRVNDRRVDPETGEKQRFRSSIVPPWARKSPKVAEVLPLLYLHGLSTGDFAPALTEFFGASAGLSPSVITRLTTQWQDEHRAFMARDLSDRDYVYCWVDGVHFNVRLEQDRLCCLVIVGVRLDGTKELVALADGYRESTDSWANLLRDLRRRGMRPARRCCRRRRPRVLGGAAGRVAPDPHPTRLGAQGRQRLGLPAEVDPAGRQEDAGRDPRRRGP